MPSSTRLCHELVDQLDFQWQTGLRPRLVGLTDEEYRWEPVPGCWSVRPTVGGHRIDFDWPPPDPPPVTTIAWRMGHITVPTLEVRAATHFGGPGVDPAGPVYAESADEAVTRLEAAYGTWITGVRGLTDHDLWEPCGEPGYEAEPMVTLVLHVHREVLHHGAEIGVLRDLFRAGLR